MTQDGVRGACDDRVPASGVGRDEPYSPTRELWPGSGGGDEDIPAIHVQRHSQ